MKFHVGWIRRPQGTYVRQGTCLRPIQKMGSLYGKQILHQGPRQRRSRTSVYNGKYIYPVGCVFYSRYK